MVFDFIMPLEALAWQGHLLRADATLALAQMISALDLMKRILHFCGVEGAGASSCVALEFPSS